MIKIILLAILMFGTIPTVFAEEYICTYLSFGSGLSPKSTIICNSVETITDDELAILIFIDEFFYRTKFYMVDTTYNVIQKVEFNDWFKYRIAP